MHSPKTKSNNKKAKFGTGSNITRATLQTPPHISLNYHHQIKTIFAIILFFILIILYCLLELFSAPTKNAIILLATKMQQLEGKNPFYNK